MKNDSTRKVNEAETMGKGERAERERAGKGKEGKRSCRRCESMNV